MKIIAQLQSLIDDAESHREPDGTLDEVFQNDISALRYAITECKRAAVREFCDAHRCENCPLNGVRGMDCWDFEHSCNIDSLFTMIERYVEYEGKV